MGAHAETSVRLAGPVLQIVPALETGLRPNRDFIVDIACSREPLDCFKVEHREDIVCRDVAAWLTPGAALFNIEHVDGNMFRPEIIDHVQILPPNIEPLVRQSGNEVNADVVEAACTQHSDIAQDIRGTVQTTGIFQILVIKRLSTEADSVYAGDAILLKFRLVKRPRIHFDTDLCAAIG